MKEVFPGRTWGSAGLCAPAPGCWQSSPASSGAALASHPSTTSALGAGVTTECEDLWEGRTEEASARANFLQFLTIRSGGFPGQSLGKVPDRPPTAVVPKPYCTSGVSGEFF